MDRTYKLPLTNTVAVLKIPDGLREGDVDALLIAVRLFMLNPNERGLYRLPITGDRIAELQVTGLQQGDDRLLAQAIRILQMNEPVTPGRCGDGTVALAEPVRVAEPPRVEPVKVPLPALPGITPVHNKTEQAMACLTSTGWTHARDVDAAMEWTSDTAAKIFHRMKETRKDIEGDGKGNWRIRAKPVSKKGKPKSQKQAEADAKKAAAAAASNEQAKQMFCNIIRTTGKAMSFADVCTAAEQLGVGTDRFKRLRKDFIADKIILQHDFRGHLNGVTGHQTLYTLPGMPAPQNPFRAPTVTEVPTEPAQPLPLYPPLPPLPSKTKETKQPPESYMSPTKREEKREEPVDPSARPLTPKEIEAQLSALSSGMKGAGVKAPKRRLTLIGGNRNINDNVIPKLRETYDIDLVQEITVDGNVTSIKLTDVFLLLTDYCSHGLSNKIMAEARKRGTTVVRARHKWSSIQQAINTHWKGKN